MIPPIQHLRVANFKGLTREFDFAGMNVITGENHAGKTAVFDAITVGLTGYHPELGKTNPATFELSSATRMELCLKGPGYLIERSWAKPGKTVKGHEEITGTPPALAPGFDAAAFIGASAKAKLTMLSTLVAGEAMKELEAKIPEWLTALDEKSAKGDTPTEKAEALETMAATLAKAQRDTVDRLKKALQTQGELGDDDKGAAVAALQEAIAASEKELTRLEAESRRLNAIAQEMEKASEAAQDAASELEGLPDAAAPLQDYETVRRAHVAAQATMESIKKPLNECSARISAATSEASANRSLLHGWKGSSGEVLAAVEAELARVEAIDVSELEAVKEHAGRALSAYNETGGKITLFNGREATIRNAIAALEDEECCPTCKAAAPGWKKEAASALNIQLMELLRDKGQAQSEHLTNMAELEKLEVKLAGLNEGAQERQRIDTLKGLVRAAKKWDKAMKTAAAESGLHAELLTRLEPAEEAAAAAFAAFEGYERQRKAAEEYAALKATAAAAPAPGALEAALNAAHEADGNEGNGRHNLLWHREQLGQAQQIAGQRKLREATVRDLEAAEKEAEKLGTLQKQIREARELALDGAYQPIIDAAAEFGMGVIEGTVKVADGDLGIARGPSFIRWGTMSGTERVVVTASIQAALSKEHGGIVMIDEIGRLDKLRRSTFAANLLIAVKEGRLRQVFLIDPDPDAWPRDFGHGDVARIDID